MEQALVEYPAAAGAGAPAGIELRHLRYLVALADAGSFTHAAEQIFITQPTLSQQIRRLEEMVDVVWLEAELDAEFSLIGARRADAGLGWLTVGPQALPAPLDAMIVGEFEPEVWVPSGHAAARRGAITVAELAGLQVIHGPRRALPGTYDAWTTAVQQVDPRFAFADPPFRRSLPMTLAFAGAGDQPAAVLTGPATPAGGWAGPARRARPADTSGMVRVSLAQHPLTASAALAWNGDLPRPLQQLLFDTADALAPPAPAQPAELACLQHI